MALTPFRGGVSPWDDLRSLQEEMGRFFGGMFGGAGTRAAGWTPAVNIVEREGELLLTAELPGMRRQDIDIALENNVLTIRGEKREEHEEKEEKEYLYERSYGSFSRAFTLPRTVDPDQIRAEFQDGVLKVHMPKTEESKGRRIQVGGGE